MTHFFVLCKRQLLREYLVSIRQLGFVVNACLFFLMMVVFFPLTFSPSSELLRLLVPGLIWMALLLAFFLSSERLFHQDYDDGVLEQWMISGQPVFIWLAAKCCIHWIFMMVPMLFFCAMLAPLFKLNQHEMLIMLISLLCGSPAIFLLCALAAAFGTGLKQNGMFMVLILLPLAIPVMIFGSGTLMAAMHGLAVNGYIALLLAMSLFALALIPIAIHGVIRITLATN